MQEVAATPGGRDALRAGAHDVMGGAGPLQLAAADGRAGLVAALLEAGALPDARDRDGRTALEVRRRFPRPVSLRRSPRLLLCCFCTVKRPAAYSFDQNRSSGIGISLPTYQATC